jgi:two-component system, OmpR family, sensor histidine kinase ArlS
MLIRHKITLWFIGSSALSLFLFSVYIYFASANSRKQLFYDRLKNKAIATKEIYDQHNLIAERIITSIPEQSEYVFDENDKLIFAINDLHDFKFDEEFFKSVTKNKELYFEYNGGVKLGYKEGYAFAFGIGLTRRLIAITAYNKPSFEQLASLATILLAGNLFFLVAVGFFAYFISTKAFKPINQLVSQVESFQGHDLNFRLKYANEIDEIGIVASSFNKLLDRIRLMVDSQKAFISFASHELRTPLAAINGTLETSLKYDRDYESVQKSQQTTKTEVERAILLVNGLLELAKIESLRGVRQKQQLNIVDILLNAISYYKAKNPSQEFSLELSDSLSKDPIEVGGDVELLLTAFTNLIDNASKYSKRNKIRITIQFMPKRKISIRIFDTGIGIENGDKTRLFDPLFRGKNTRGFDGFGLGLSLTQRIIALHDGAIFFYANEPVGTIAEVQLITSSKAIA